MNNVVYVHPNLYELDLFVEARSSNTNLLSVANGIKVATRQKENNKRRRHEKKELRTRLNISTFMFWKKIGGWRLRSSHSSDVSFSESHSVSSIGGAIPGQGNKQSPCADPCKNNALGKAPAAQFGCPFIYLFIYLFIHCNTQ